MLLIQNEDTIKRFRLTDHINDPSISDFLMNDERARIYHHPAWIKSLCDAYGGTPYYVISTDSETEKMNGLFPFILFNNRSGKKKIISLPYTNYCDNLLHGIYDTNYIIKLIEKQLGTISSYDFRNLNEEPVEGFSNNSDFLVHVIELKPTLDETYKSFGKRSIRRFIKKAEEKKLTFRLGETDEDFKLFYQLEVKLRKSIGLPPAPVEFFYSIWTNLKKQNLIFLPIVSFDNEPVAASMVLHYKDRIYFEYTGLSKKHKNLYGNHMLHWEMIKIAHNDGVRFVELGRVDKDNKDLIFFKENWGALPFKIYHRRSPSQKKNFLARIKNFTYPSFVKINKHLPAALLKLEGRMLYKYLKLLLLFGLLLK
jgi:hypothetical protein